jgi:hypothetical protein
MAMSKHPAKRTKQLANLRVNSPAGPGNRRSVKHGGQAKPEPRRQKALEAQIRDALPVRDADGNPPAHDAIAVGLLAIVLCQLESVTRYIARNGPLTRGGKIAPSAVLQDKLIVRSQNLASELGLTPRSRVNLGLTLKQTEHLDLAALLSDAPRKSKQIDIPDATVVDDE